MKKRLWILTLVCLAALFCLTACMEEEDYYTKDKVDASLTEVESKVSASKAELESKLDASVDALEKELAEKTEQNKEAIASLKLDYDAKISLLEKSSADNKAAIESLTATYTAKVEALEAKDKATAEELAALKTKYASDLAALNAKDAENETKLAELTAAYTAKVKALEAKDEATAEELAALKTKYASDLAALNEKDAEIASALTSCKNELQGKLDQLNVDFIEETKEICEALDGLKSTATAHSDRITALENQLAAILAPDTVTVTFDPQNGEAPFTVDVERLTNIDKPSDPILEGYVFDGWYLDGEKWSFVKDAVIENMMLKAQWREKISEPELTEGLRFHTLTVHGSVVDTVIVSNATEEYSFLDEITTYGQTTYVVSFDRYGIKSALTKKIPLEIGNNTVYIIEMIGDEVQEIYTVTVRRRPIYTLTFHTAGGTSVPSQSVEEGYLASEPTATREGYTFDSWSYDFAQPIMQSMTVTASWTANTDTPYCVEYYLQNVEDNGYPEDPVLTLPLVGTTDTTASAEQKTFEHFTLNTYKSTLSGNIHGDGSLALKLYYTRDSYIVTSDRNNTLAGGVTKGGSYKYDTKITLTATTNEGYTFLGWFEGEEKVCDTLSYTFNVDHTATYTAKWEANTYTVTFDENSGDTTHEDLTVTYDNRYTLPTPEKLGYTFLGWYDEKDTKWNESGTWKRADDLSLTAKWQINRYTVTVNGDPTDGGTVSGGGTYDYGTSVTLTATPNRGCDFIGWYVGDTQVSTDRIYTFVLGAEHITVTAKWQVPEGLEDFTFEMTEDSCTITGVKDTTKTSIVVPDYVTAISKGAFSGCTSLTSITLPFIGMAKDGTSNTHFGYIFGASAYFYHDDYVPTSLKTVVITGGTSIGDRAFYGCTSLSSITIPDSVTSIGDYAFYGCTSLTYNTYDNAEYLGNQENPYLVLVEATSTAITSCTIHPDTRIINHGAFSACTSLSSITIPDSVTSIGNYAFFWCESLSSITIPAGVISIGVGAFSYCDSLLRITVEEGNSVYHSEGNCIIETETKTLIQGCNTSVIPSDGSVTSIGDYAFSACTSLSSITIPDSVTSIGDSAFYNCTSLSSITIPGSVTSIGDCAFYGCTLLSSIKYCGTEAQWNAISKGRSWNDYTGWYTITYNYK